MRTRRWLLLALATVASAHPGAWAAPTQPVATVAAPPAPAPPPGRPAATSDLFVRARGAALVLGDRPFHFVGANLAIMHGPQSRASAEVVLEGAARDGLRVGRVWALGEGDADAAPWIRDNYLFRAGPDGWIDAAGNHLDRVLVAARRAGVRLVITLANSWGDYGGVPRYLRWAGGFDGDAFAATERFYSDPQARAAYRAHVERLLRRTNHLTGVAYRDDPTILGWELMNESTVVTPAGAAARQRWIVEMARLIHGLDPNHLVTPGVSGYRLERERRDWLAVCKLPEIDFCDGHIYPEEAFATRDPAGLELAIDDFVQLAQHIAKKPFVLGEFGVRGDAGGVWLGQPRAAWIARVLGRLLFDAAAGGMVWIYQPKGGPDTGHGIGVGDPAHEPIRAALRAAAAELSAEAELIPPGGFNPALGDERGEEPLMPLRAELPGREASVPFAREGAATFEVAWDAPAFDRADWEATGVFRGGALQHAWGSETGWFEYRYLVVATGVARPGRPPAAVTVRARVSSEFPGTQSPPDGTSAFEVTLDGQPVGRAVAARDDGRGRWITLRAARPELARAALAPGPHRLRFTVAAGPGAHGLCLYGRPGEKATPADAGEGGLVELLVQ